jgi:hypothetical protein
MLADVPWRWEVVKSSLATEKGYWLPSDEPGLVLQGTVIALSVLMYRAIGFSRTVN